VGHLMATLHCTSKLSTQLQACSSSSDCLWSSG
jgi:hypothetical protein